MVLSSAFVDHLSDLHSIVNEEIVDGNRQSVLTVHILPQSRETEHLK